MLGFPRPVAWVVLGLALAATAGGWAIARQHAALEARRLFDEAAGQVAAALNERMRIYEGVLHGTVGLHAASQSVERHEWRAYLESVSISQRFPGIDAIGFAARVLPGQVEDFLEVTRADGAPGFNLKPPGIPPEDERWIIRFVEPEAHHSTLLGVDLRQEPASRAAMEQSATTGDPVLGTLAPMGNDDGVTTSGCLLVLPVYARQPVNAGAERRLATIEGWVFARFLVGELMAQVLETTQPGLHLSVFDASAAPTANLVFDSAISGLTPRPNRARLSSSAAVRLGGRVWRLDIASLPSFEARAPRGSGLLVGVGGGFISLLLFGIAWSLSQTRERAVALAEDMTAALRRSNEQLEMEITERRKSESSLEHERFLLRTLMDNLPDRIYFKDLQSRFLRNSRAHLKRLGIEDQRAAMGKSDFDFLSEESARRTYQDEQQVIRNGQALNKEEETISADGLKTWALITKMPLRDEHGNLVGTFGISRDITERKLAEEAMRQAKEAAEEASRAKSQFLASMSHELRTPLNSVIGFANILLKNKAGTLGAAELNFLDRILANGKHLLALINDILDLSKIEARKVELETLPVALDALVRETIAQEEGLVRDKPVQLLADLPATVAPLSTDPDKLKQILINLIGNALKFTERGSVTVRVVTDPMSHQPLRLEVVDTGIGIPSDKLGVIFQAFQQAETGTTRKYGGTGLGLTISQALCHLLGFRIEVRSEPGQGSTFSVLLPHPAQPPLKPAGTPAPITTITTEPPPPDLKGKLVLVIDDELDSRTLLTHLIEDFGCRALAASSGEQGLHLAREFRPHLITVDLMMPQMDGWQVIRALKADPALSDIPVVVVSIVAAENRGGILGAVDILQKPVQRDDLLAALRRSLSGEHPRLLLVDDEEDARRVLAGHLADEPCELRMAANGREALEVLREYPADLILLDLVMPEMDGMAFLQEIRSRDQFKWVPVIVITARDLTPEETARLRRSAQEVVRKGDVFEADLKTILRRLLQDHPRHRPPPVP